MQIPELITWEEPKNSLNKLGSLYLHRITNALNAVNDNELISLTLERLVKEDELLRLYYNFYLNKIRQQSMFWDPRLIVVCTDPKFVNFICLFTFDQLRQAISDNPNHFNISNHEIAELTNYYYD